MAASDSRPVPRKNVAFRIYFALRDGNNDLVTSWSSTTFGYSKDGGTFTNVTPTNMVEIATASGCGYVDLSSSIMNCDCLVLKFGASGAKDVVIILYPEEIGDYRTRVEQISLAASGDMVGAVWDETAGNHRLAGSTGLALITASGSLIGGDWSTHNAADVAAIVGASGMIADRADYVLSATHGAGSWATATGFAVVGEPLTSTEVAQAVWNATMSSYDSAGSTGQALVTSSGNLIGSASGPDAATIATAVWDKQLGEHLTVNSAGWALGVVGSGIVTADTVQVSGEYISLRDIATGNLDTAGLASTTQLEYWALQILNNCGGGSVG